jgi:hypothetical protein
MSRSTVVRRLTAAITLLAVLCLAAPAVAATPGTHSVKSHQVSTTSVLDQLLAWLASLGFGPAAPTRSSSLTKSTSLSLPPVGVLGQTGDSADASQGMDPNGHQ